MPLGNWDRDSRPPPGAASTAAGRPRRAGGRGARLPGRSGGRLHPAQLRHRLAGVHGLVWRPWFRNPSGRPRGGRPVRPGPQGLNRGPPGRGHRQGPPTRGHLSPTEHESVRLVLAGIRRTKGMAPAQKAPLLTAAVLALTAACHPTSLAGAPVSIVEETGVRRIGGAVLQPEVRCVSVSAPEVGPAPGRPCACRRQRVSRLVIVAGNGLIPLVVLHPSGLSAGSAGWAGEAPAAPTCPTPAGAV